MKIEYEVGDEVFAFGEYGCNPWTIEKVYWNGLTISRKVPGGDERTFAGRNDVEPTPQAIDKASFIRPERANANRA